MMIKLYKIALISIISLVLTGCITNPKATYHSGYGSINVPINNSANVRIPIQKDQIGKVRVSTQNVSFSI